MQDCRQLKLDSPVINSHMFSDQICPNRDPNMATDPDRERSPEDNHRDDLPAKAEMPSLGAPLRSSTPMANVPWKSVFHERVQPRALDLQGLKMEKLRKKTLQQKKTEKEEPADSLSQDWFNTESMTLETRAYLLDKLLPTLVPAVEKLLKVAERKKALEPTEAQPPCPFDPMIFLGEYLMRHNPAYDLTAQPNPYVRGLKAITDQLKARVPDTTMHKLAQMKNLVEEKRHFRESVENIKAQVNQLREQTLAVQFHEWTLDATGQLPLALIQSALKSFLEVISKMPQFKDAELYAKPLGAMAPLDLKVNQEEFIEYLLSYVNNFTSELFEELLKHLLRCSHDARNAIRHDIWRQMFVQLFFDCDYGQMGLLDRLRVLSLLERFYQCSSDFAKEIYCNPKKWPIVELDDIDLTEFWGHLERDDEEEPAEDLLSPQRTLSEEASFLSQVLKDILSEAKIDLGTSTESAVDGVEEASLEQPLSPSEAGTEDLPATQDQEEERPEGMPVVELEAEGAEAATEEAERPAGEEEAVAEDHPDVEPQAVAEGEEAEGDLQPQEDLLASPSQVAARVKQILESQDESPAKAPSAEKGLATDGTEAGETDGQERPEETTEPGMEAEETAGLEKPVEEAGMEAAEETGGQEKAEEKAEPEVQRPPILKGQAAGPPITVVTVPSMLPGQDSLERAEGPQRIYGEAWSGNFQTSDLTFKYADYGKAIREDWNKEDSRFSDLRLGMLEIRSRGPPASLSPFDKNSLNLPQFVQLLETFVTDGESLPRLKKLVQFVRRGYLQTGAQKFSLLEKVHRSSALAHKELLIAALFEKWDNESSGFLEMSEVDSVLNTFKEGMEEEALTKAKMQLPFPTWHPSGIVKLTQKDFHIYIEMVMAELTGTEDEVLDNIVEFLMMAVGGSHLERLRGNARRKWLLRIEHMAKTSGGCMEPIYQEVFKALSRDIDAHGDRKKVSAYIALLEYNVVAPERGDILLRYVACTEDDAPFLLNQVLFMDMPGVSFAAALDDKPIHVPRVQLHGNIHFWNPDRPKEEQRGSFLVLPLEDVQRRVFGILGLDTLQDKNGKKIFVPHEIRYYQGIAHSFSKAYHYIRTQQSLMQIILAGVEWLFGRAPGLQSITAYFMEPGESRMHDYTLRKVLDSDLKEEVKVNPPPAPTVTREEDVFRDYLFKSVDCALVVTQRLYGEFHVAVPLRNTAGEAIMVLDLNLGPKPQLSPCAHKDLQKMLKMAQAATHEILKEDSGELEPYYVLEAEYVGDWRRGSVLFYRFMLQDLQNCIWNLDPWTSFADIRSMVKPPALVQLILKCVVLLLYPQWAGTAEVERWSTCIQKLDGELIENICYFDPTASYVDVRPEVLQGCLKGVRRKAVWRFGSAPLEYLYNWARACLSLIEIAKKLQHRTSTVDSVSALLTPTLSTSIRSSQISALRSISFTFPANSSSVQNS
ncbi:EF-hand calcium-binding domain-containing protein 5 [Erythrolamprus reginae]|uniref:EF-hand calcium-binding domain-containing protein 5 n=1 Tax=Erythrolamprus reginae TaxID=121349 RepID=UPI00396CF9CE